LPDAIIAASAITENTVLLTNDRFMESRARNVWSWR
jgi:predicted nucleic acid-binding protein